MSADACCARERLLSWSISDLHLHSKDRYIWWTYTYDFLAWTVDLDSLVTYTHELHMPGDSALVRPFQENQMITFEATVVSATMNEFQSSLSVVLPTKLNGLSIRCEGESTPTINVTSTVIIYTMIFSDRLAMSMFFNIRFCATHNQFSVCTGNKYSKQ